MNLKHAKISTTLLCLLVAGLLLACGLSTPITSHPATQNAPAPGQTLQGQAPQGQAPQTGSGFDPTQAGLPSDVPIYPGAHDFTGFPNLMLDYVVDVDVVTASNFYLNALNASGWSVFSTNGVDQGSCGDDDPFCGGPTWTPGPTATATPNGWMSQNTQMWTKGNMMIMILYSVHSGGGTDITITMTSQ